MAKPIIKKIQPFDARYDGKMDFIWSGTRAYGNRCKISIAETLTEVYNQVSNPNFLLSHTIPSGTLINGVRYVVQISVIDEFDVESPLSDKMYFYCVENPTYGFAGLSATEVNKLNDASYKATIDYHQPNWEDVQLYKFHLYDGGKTLLLSSEEMYDKGNITYTYRGLETGKTYYIRWTGVTINGLDLDTGYVELFVDYKNPTTYASIYAENDPVRGYIQYSTNIKIIQYNGDEQFTFDRGKIILDNKKIYYDEGFNIEGDFTLKIKGIDLWQTAEIFKGQNSDGQSFTVSSRIYDTGDTTTLRFKLTVPSIITNYIIYSEPLVFEPEDMVTIVVRRINDVWGIYTFVTEGQYEEEIVATYFSDTRPTTDVKRDDYWIENGEVEITRIPYEEKVVYTQEFEPLTAKTNELWVGGAELTDNYILYVRNGKGTVNETTLIIVDQNSSVIEQTANLVCDDDTYETVRWIKEV